MYDDKEPIETFHIALVGHRAQGVMRNRDEDGWTISPRVLVFRRTNDVRGENCETLRTVFFLAPQVLNEKDIRSLPQSTYTSTLNIVATGKLSVQERKHVL